MTGKGRTPSGPKWQQVLADFLVDLPYSEMARKIDLAERWAREFLAREFQTTPDPDPTERLANALAEVKQAAESGDPGAVAALRRLRISVPEPEPAPPAFNWTNWIADHNLANPHRMHGRSLAAWRWIREVAEHVDVRAPTAGRKDSSGGWFEPNPEARYADDAVFEVRLRRDNP